MTDLRTVSRDSLAVALQELREQEDLPDSSATDEFVAERLFAHLPAVSETNRPDDPTIQHEQAVIAAAEAWFDAPGFDGEPATRLIEAVADLRAAREAKP